MASQDFIVHPVVDSESIDLVHWVGNPDTILYHTPNKQDQAGYFGRSWQAGISWNPTDAYSRPVVLSNSGFPPNEQGQAGYFGQSWQTEIPWKSTHIESLPVGLSRSYFPPCEGTESQRTDLHRPPRLRLSSVNTASSGSYMPETRSSPPKTPLEGINTTPTTSTTRRKRRGRPAHPIQRKTHNEIEARYRETINAAVKTLQQVVPPPILDEVSIDDRKRPNFTKAATMIGAAEYIKHLEVEHRRLIEENTALRAMAAHRRPLPN